MPWFYKKMWHLNICVFCASSSASQYGKTRLTESDWSVDKRHRTALMQIMVKQTGCTEKRNIRADAIKSYKLTEEANTEWFFTVFNYREKMVHQIKLDDGRFTANKKELILHIIYNFCIIYSGNICHKMLLLRNILWHKSLTIRAIFWETPWQAISVSDSSLSIYCSLPLDIWC